MTGRHPGWQRTPSHSRAASTGAPRGRAVCASSSCCACTAPGHCSGRRQHRASARQQGRSCGGNCTAAGARCSSSVCFLDGTACGRVRLAVVCASGIGAGSKRHGTHGYGDRHAQHQQGSAPQQQVPAQPLAPSSFSPLHDNIVEFCRHVNPSDQELTARRRLIDGVAAAVRDAFDDPLVRLQPFGSFLSGTSTWRSDVDLVVTGLVTPNAASGSFSNANRQLVLEALKRLITKLRRGKAIRISQLAIIMGARIPLIKLATPNGLQADISIGDNSGPRAARYVAQMADQFPQLLPLVLVLKVYLRSCGLNEVVTGGLSSFSLVNMVLAHLQEELKASYDISDLGETLHSFLVRFGSEFDYELDAVSVAAGGIVPKASLPAPAVAASHRPVRPAADHLPAEVLGYEDTSGIRLRVDDPLTGRDVSSGTNRIQDVQAALHQAALRLQLLAMAPQPPGFNYLDALFDVEAALRRPDRAGPTTRPKVQRVSRKQKEQVPQQEQGGW